MNQKQYQPLFKQQSTKSLNKYRSESIEQRAMRIGKELLIPAIPKSKQTKNVFTITTNTSHSSQRPNEIRGEQQLQRKVRMLEYELKRKLTQDSFLKNIFRTKQTHELNHLDLYLELRNLQDKYTELAKHQEESRHTANEYQKLLRQQQQQHMRNMQELNECVIQKEEQWLQEKGRLKEEAEKCVMQNEESKFLLEELKKKNSQLLKKNKQLAEEINIEKQTQNLAFLKLKDQSERQIHQLKEKLSKALERVANLTASASNLQQEQKDLLHEVEETKDLNQKLQMQLKQFEQHNRDLSIKMAQLKQEQKEKYLTHYEKLTKDHQIQIENLIIQNNEALLKQKQQNNEIQRFNNTLTQQLTTTQKELQQHAQLVAQLKERISQLEGKLQQSSKQLQRQQEANARLSREIKEGKFQREEMKQQMDKMKFQLADQAKIQEKLVSQIKNAEEQKQKITLKCEELKVAADNTQAYRKLNDKIYNQNYKTIGRLIEINNKLKQQLSQEQKEQTQISEMLKKCVNQESLSEIVTHLNELLSYLFKSYQTQKKEKQELTRQINIENRQISNLLQHCRHILSNESIDSLLVNYITLLKQRKHQTHQHKQRAEIYHELIENLISMNNVRYFSSDNRKFSHAKDLKDSLDSPQIHQEYQSKKKICKQLERQSSCQLRRKQKIQTEPSLYDLPLKRKLIIEEEDKENNALNLNKPQQQQIPKRQSHKYTQQIRQRISSKYPSKRKQPKQDLRSQVQKKYFR